MKIAWYSWSEAEAAAIATMEYDHAANKRMARPLLAYRCMYCRAWHVGHSYGPWPNEGEPIERRFRNSPRLLAQRTIYSPSAGGVQEPR